MIRLFVAMHIPDGVKEEIFRMIGEIIPGYGKYKWEKKDKIHLTLKFIGNVDENLTDEIRNKLSFIENYNKFHFDVGGFNFFFNHNVPRILWLGLETGDPIKKLVKEIEDNLTFFSILPEKREFRSHLTLMRIKIDPGRSFVESFKGYKVPEIKFVSDKVILMQSLLKSTGSEYKEIKVYKLN